MPLVVYTPIAALLVYLSLQALSLPFSVGAALLGYAIWTLIEYFGHRYLFHYEFPGRIGARLHFLMHGVHHVHPNDSLRLVMPPLLSGPIMLIALGVTTLLFGLPVGLPVLLGFVIGYLVYDMTHYYLHHAEPKTRLGLMMRRDHMLHHFRDSTKGYGVAAFWWDHVFGTAFGRSRNAAR
jgi:sterol desaturase/sphingolipid hydroxylase (fatty acid hydroxylase superfamily)